MSKFLGHVDGTILHESSANKRLRGLEKGFASKPGVLLEFGLQVSEAHLSSGYSRKKLFDNVLYTFAK
eukprot:4781922-Amphidinium_carterae.1